MPTGDFWNQMMAQAQQQYHGQDLANIYGQGVPYGGYPLSQSSAVGGIGNCTVVGGVSAARPGEIIRVGGGASKPKLGQAAIPPQPIKSKGKGMFSEIATDVKSFIMEHRSIIYFVALALIVDHLLFKDVFRTRLQGIVEGIIKKVENKVNS